MEGLTAALRNELQLMIYRKKTIIFILVSVILPVLLILLFHSLQPILGIVAVSPSYPVQMLEIYTVFLIPLFMMVEIADLFPQEISSRTLKLALLRPVTRLGVYTAKFLVLGIAIGILLLLLGTVSTLCNLLFGTPGTGSLHIFSLLKAYAAAFLSMWSLAALFVFTAQFFRSAAGFLVFSILLYTGAKTVPYLINGFAFFSITSYTDWYSLWLSHTVSTGRLATTTLFLLSGMFLFVTLGYIFFDRKEI
ncbi:ABC transporter permease [Paenibacillus sp. P46E]|uniref:ABC transporter permease n=1 Tax=Paenibacillus sp. P46E TaxID=1349436 RepID=UPI00093D26B4|nr:ABC transporter permease [Paenibacillus sp. P46E]OKP95327.1 hypothetical protein A3849_26615 [Paenibacillus sp. P46E]